MGVFDRKSEEGEAAAPAPADDPAGKPKLSGKLGSWIGRSGDLVASVAGSVKDVSRSPILRQALEARDRGNLGAAFYLVKEEHGLRPDEDEVAGAFWDIALAYERPGDAAEAVAGLIRRRTGAGAIELASQYWAELHEHVPDALLEPATFARLIPQLAEQTERDREEAAAEADRPEPTYRTKGEEAEARALREATRAARTSRTHALRSALKGVVDERNSGLTAGLALRVAELARELDPETALRAARFAVDVEDLHEAKRQRLVDMIRELDPRGASALGTAQAASSPEPGPEPEPESEPAPAEAPTDPLEEQVASEDISESELRDASLLDGSPTGEEIETAAIREDDPARNHPMRVVSPPSQPLTDDELATLQARLPRSNSPHAVVAPAEEASDEQPEPTMREAAASEVDAEVEAALAAANPEDTFDPRVAFGGNENPLDLDESGYDIRSASGKAAPTREEPGPAREENPPPGAEFEALAEDLANGTEAAEAGVEVREGDPSALAEQAARDASVDDVSEEPAEAPVELSLEAAVGLPFSSSPEVEAPPSGRPFERPSSPVASDTLIDPTEGVTVDDGAEVEKPYVPSPDELEFALELAEADGASPATSGPAADCAPPNAFEVPVDASIVIDQDADVGSQSASEELALFSDLKAVEAQPLSLDTERLVVGMSDGRQTVIGLDQVEAIAVAQVDGLAEDPVVVVDLALDWRTAGDGPLRVVRLRSDALDLSGLAPDIADPSEALRSLLSRLMERTRAVPLPDPDAALGLMIPAYGSVEAYEREVLQVARRAG